MSIKSHKDNNNGNASLARKSGHLTVAASPLNAVKLDLAIIIVMAVIMIMLVTHLVEEYTNQIVYLAGFGLVSLLWLVIRTRRVLSACQGSQSAQGNHEA